VQGENSGKNSIGKSSFLLAIDYAFGGDDYAKDIKIINKVGHHTINFCFVFNGKHHYFARSTQKEKGDKGKDVSVVYKCNEDYVPFEKMPLVNFRTFLLKEYSLTLPQATFRGIVGLFFRIYGRDTVKDVQQPLTYDLKQPVEASLISFLKLYDLYAPVEQSKKQRDEKESYKDALLAADNNKVIRLINQREYLTNINGLEELQIKLDELATHGSAEITLLDENITARAMEYKAQFEALSKQKRVLWARYYSIERAAEFRRPATQQDLNELLKYFPNSNIRDIAEMENFHKQLSQILMNEFENAKASILSEINRISSEMETLETQMQEINLPQQISKKTLKTCGEIYSQMNRLQNENDFYDKKKQVDNELKIAVQQYDKIFIGQYDILQGTLNVKLDALNTYIYGSDYPPTLSVVSTKAYKYETEFDGGTGTDFKNLILLDLSSLELTPLPTLAHDTVIFKNIEQPAMAKIIELYQKISKQVFIAFDETTKYPQTAQEIIEAATVLKLSYGGNELFGWSWQKRTVN
jgi:hypothetical protein